ncbi:MAG: hypothetical protein QM500_09715 [Methylococcales bacterium]
MSDLISEKRIDVINAYKMLLTELESLGGHLRLDAKNGMPAWVQHDKDDETSASDTIISIYQTLTIKKGYTPRESFTLFGLMAVSPETLQQVAVVNACKKALKEAFIALKKKDVRETTMEAAYKEIQRSPLIREALRAAGLAKLHIKQSTRRIATISEMPLRVGFTVSRGSHIVRKVSNANAVNLAEKYNNEKLAEQIESIGDPEFAQVRQLASHVRANITYLDCKRIKERKDQLPACMPILYPYNAEQTLKSGPVIHNGDQVLLKLNNNIDFSRRARGDGTIDKNAVVSESLKLYRYRKYVN